MTSLALDPSGFQILVVMVVDGKEVPLWTRDRNDVRDDQSLANTGEGSKPTGGISGRDLAIVESVELELNQGLSGRVTVEIGAPYELGVQILNSRLLRVGNEVQVQIGYPRLNRLTPWFSAQTSKPSIQISPEDGLSVTINGEGGGFSSMRGEAAIKSTSSYAGAMQAIADLHGWQITLPDQQGNDDPLYVEREFSQELRTNWRQLHYMANAANVNVFLAPSRDGESRGTTLYVTRRSKSFAGRGPRGQSSDTIFSFVMRGRTDFRTSFPLLSYESELEGVWLPRGATQVITNDLNPDTLEEEEAEATPQDTEVPAVGGDRVPNASQQEGDAQRVGYAAPQGGDDSRGAGSVGERVNVSSRDPRRPQDVVRSRQHESQVRGGIQATCDAIGIPELWPSQTVAIRGLGLVNGIYVVDGLTHRADSSEWTMNMRLIASALSAGLIAESLSDDPPRSNTQEPEPPSEHNDATSGSSTVRREPEDPT